MLYREIEGCFSVKSLRNTPASLCLFLFINKQAIKN